MYIYQIMSNNFGYIDIILLAMIAGFIILRLRNILGRKTGHQNKVFTSFDEKKFEQFKKETLKPEDKKQKETLEGFKKEDFLKGAESAYESIIVAFAEGKRNKLKELLRPDVAKNFEQAITQREADNIKSELTFIGMKKSEVEKFEKIKNELYVTVKFVCEIISVKRDKNNNIIEGNPDKIKTVTDHWQFSKNALTKNPNWYLCQIINK